MRQDDPMPRADESTVGRKGRATRDRILDAVEQRCLETHHREITVAQIAAATGIAPATFYTYFPDLGTATAEIAQRHFDQFSTVIDSAGALARPDVTESDYQRFVAGFYQYWAVRRGLLETILAAQIEDDHRYYRVLLNLMKSVTHALAPAVRHGHQLGTAGSLVMMLATAAARTEGFERDGVPYDELLAAQVKIVRAAIEC